MQSSEYSAFISYATPDSGKAQEICARLEAHGLRCWIAPRDVRAGREYANEIITGIERSRCLVLVLSVAANESQFVGREVERAVTKGRPVVPVRIEPVLPSPGLELFVSATQWIDAWSGDWEGHIDHLVRDLAEDPLATGTSAVRAVSVEGATDDARWSARRVLSGAAAFALVVVLAAVASWYGIANPARQRSPDPATTPASPPVETRVPPIPAAASQPQVATPSRQSVSRARIVQTRETPPPPAPAAQPVSSPAPAQDAAELEALEQLREQGTALAIRAQVVDASLNRMAEQMRPNGLRGDIALRQQSLASSLAGGQRALDQRNVAAATKYFDRARSDVEALERFLGR